MDITEYSKRSQFYLETAPPLLLDLFERHRGGSCLDLGCGDGNVLHALKARGLLEGRTVYALDISPNRIANVRQGNPEFHCQVADACDPSGIADQSIDLLMSTMVIEHVPSDEAMLRQIARVLRAGGRAYISTVFKKPWAWYFHRCNGRWALDPTHVREYTREGQLLDLLTRAGLTVLHSRKTLLAYPLIDPLLRVLGCSRQVYLHSFLLRALRRIKLPILGYFNWEIVCQKM